MNFARKVQKLFTAEALESLWDHAKRWTHPVDSQRICDGIDRKAWDDLRARYPQRPDAPRINRFSDVDHWLKINVERAQDLWLDRTTPLRILDLGCGPGYFSTSANNLVTNVSASTSTSSRFSARQLRCSGCVA